jgi:hypothetical protein
MVFIILIGGTPRRGSNGGVYIYGTRQEAEAAAEALQELCPDHEVQACSVPAHVAERM